MQKEVMERYCERHTDEIIMLTKDLSEEKMIKSYELITESFYRLLYSGKDYRNKTLRALSNKMSILECGFELRTGEQITDRSNIDILNIIKETKHLEDVIKNKGGKDELACR